MVTNLVGDGTDEVEASVGAELDAVIGVPAEARIQDLERVIDPVMRGG
jgi:hypothetical protein